MSAPTIDKLVYMANQIARNLALDADPVGATAAHITAFWTPRMIEQVLAHGSEGIDRIAGGALARIAQAGQLKVSDVG